MAIKLCSGTPMLTDMLSKIKIIIGRDFEDVDFKKSVLHLSWHPKENSVAIAATNNLYLFSTL